jgi:hypothetical protein
MRVQMSPQYQSTIVLSLAHRAKSQRPPSAVVARPSPRFPAEKAASKKRRPPTLHIKLPAPQAGDLLTRHALPCPPIRPGRKWQREIEGLVQSFGEDRLRTLTKRALVNYVVDQAKPACREGLREYVWIAERLCDRELIEILVEVASRCFAEGAVSIGRAGAQVVARQNCAYSRAWLEWLWSSIEDAELARFVYQLYLRQLS